MTTFMTYKEERDVLRQQLAEKDGEIERLKEELTTAAIDIKKAIDESRKVLVADWTEKFSLQQQQLAASQAREVQLREALQQEYDYQFINYEGETAPWVAKALALPQDTTALEAMIAEAGEVMRERCERESWLMAPVLRSIPEVTLEDFRK